MGSIFAIFFGQSLVAVTLCCFFSQGAQAYSQKDGATKLPESIRKEISQVLTAVTGVAEPKASEGLSSADNSTDEDSDPYKNSELRLLGALFICDPFCEFVSQVTTKGFESSARIDTSPPATIRFYSVYSDIYRAVFTSKEQDEYLQSVLSGKKQVVYETTRRDQIEVFDPDPGFKLPQLNPYFTLSLGLASDKHFSSSFGLNEDLNDQSYYQQAIELGVFPAKVFTFLTGKFRNHFSMESGASKSRQAMDASAQEIKSVYTTFNYRLVYVGQQLNQQLNQPSIQYYLATSYEESSIAVHGESPRLFSTDSTSLYVGLGATTKNLGFEWLTNTRTNLKDSQSYRANPLSANINRYRLQFLYPSSLLGELGELQTTLEYKKTEEKSRIDPTYILNSAKIELHKEQWLLNFGYKIKL